MGFVLERIDEKGMEYLEQFNLKDPFSSRDPAYVYAWCVDWEREIMLIPLGGCGLSEEKPEIFSFIYHKTVGEIFTYNRGRENVPKVIDITWFLYSIQLPRQLSSQEEELREVIMEAFNVYGAGLFKTKKTGQVEFGEINKINFNR